MKKMISSLALLFAGAAILCAAPVDANGMFKRYNKKTFAPADWSPNMAPKHAKLINLTVKPSEDPKKSNVLTIDTTKGGGVPLRHVKGIPCKPGDEIIITAEDDPEDEPLPETMTVHYDVPGSARKALANAIGEAIGAYPAYKAAPTFAYIIGEYTLDRNGVLTGPRNSQLMLTLDQDGYRTK